MCINACVSQSLYSLRHAYVACIRSLYPYVCIHAFSINMHGVRACMCCSVCARVCAYMCACVYARTFARTCEYLCERACVRVCTCVCVFECVCM